MKYMNMVKSTLNTRLESDVQQKNYNPYKNFDKNQNFQAPFEKIPTMNTKPPKT